MRGRRYIGSILLLLITTATAAQTKKLVREGNELYRQQRYKDAAMLYQEANLSSKDVHTRWKNYDFIFP